MPEKHEQKTGLAHYASESKYPVWSMEAFGQFLRSADFLSLPIFPQYIAFPKNNHFRRTLDHLLGSSGESRSYIEQLAIIATNDKGELMLSKAYEKGTLFQVGIKPGSEVDMLDRQISSLPAGWRRLGSAHSHPRFPLVGKFYYFISDLMLAFRFSPDDIASFAYELPKGRPIEVVVTPTGYGIMVASDVTKRKLQQYNISESVPLTNDSVKNNPLAWITAEIRSELTFNPQKALIKYGIAYYACGRWNNVLRRVI